jgi:KipI family sensor histidine kinase inhibitor
MRYEMPVYHIMGDKSLLVELGDDISFKVHLEVRALFWALQAESIEGLVDIVPSYRSLLLIFDPLRLPLPLLKEIVERNLAADKRRQLPEPKKIRVPVVYGDEYGPDLAWVADYLKTTPKEVIHYHASVTYRVYMIGFTPGYPYLGEVPDAIVVPRRQTPRTSVPRGSVGIAQQQTGIYPVESPGGWQIIGRTPINLFDPTQQPPTRLEMGDLVKFYAISADDWSKHEYQAAF